jgi:hypothetical protein
MPQWWPNCKYSGGWTFCNIALHGLWLSLVYQDALPPNRVDDIAGSAFLSGGRVEFTHLILSYPTTFYLTQEIEIPGQYFFMCRFLRTAGSVR